MSRRPITLKDLDAMRRSVDIAQRTIENVAAKALSLRPADDGALSDELAAWASELADAAEDVAFADRWARRVEAQIAHRNRGAA